MDTIRERLRWAVKKSGKTMRQASLEAGLADGHIGLIVRGTVEDPRQDTVEAIARVLGISAEWLWSGKGAPEDLREAPANDAPGADNPNPVLGNLHNWPQLKRAALRIEPRVPEGAIAYLEKKAAWLTGPLNAQAVYDMALLVMKHVPPEKWS